MKGDYYLIEAWDDRADRLIYTDDSDEKDTLIEFSWSQITSLTFERMLADKSGVEVNAQDELEELEAIDAGYKREAERNKLLGNFWGKTAVLKQSVPMEALSPELRSPSNTYTAQVGEEISYSIVFDATKGRYRHTMQSKTFPPFIQTMSTNGNQPLDALLEMIETENKDWM